MKKEGVKATGAKPKTAAPATRSMTAAAVAKKLGKPYKQDKHFVWVGVKPKDVKNALETVREATERISDISVFDAGKELEVTYRFFIGGVVLNVKTRIAADRPRLPTCTRLFPGALLIEREQHEMFGVFFYGHPNLDNVLFSESTPKRPLRRKDDRAEAKGAKHG